MIVVHVMGTGRLAFTLTNRTCWESFVQQSPKANALMSWVKWVDGWRKLGKVLTFVPV